MLEQDGLTILKESLKTLPSTPGVYRMYNIGGEVLYIGKAINLKNRVTQYTHTQRLPHRLQQMVFLTHRLEVVEVPSEAEALLLEANLIKTLQPRYNIRLKDDSTYPGIYITPPQPANGQPLAPQLKVQRGRRPKHGHFFGPYPSSQSAHMIIALLERLFKLRTCRDGVYKTRQRPCLKFHIQRCSGPCAGKISAQDYQKSVADAVLFLEGKTKEIQQNIQHEMLEAAAREDFEAAARNRDKLSTLANITAAHTTTGLYDADVLALVHMGGKTMVQIFSYRHGQHVGNSRHLPEEVADLPEDEALTAFLTLYYHSNKPPRHVLTNHAVNGAHTLAKALHQLWGHKPNFSCPQKGEKLHTIRQAEANAKAALERQQAEKTSQSKTLAEFAALLEMKTPLRKIECFDISNTQGRDPVASLVVMTEDGIAKNSMRKFAIRTKNTPDDYAMMREALTRRYSRLFKEEPAEAWPQVIMVDGGKGHLNILVDVFKTLGVTPEERNITLCAIAKGEERDKGLERIFKAGAPAPLAIGFNSPLIFMLQRLRDEAHRVAIGYHRQKRAKALTTSQLDELPQIGPKRKKALLQHFGSVPQLKRASLRDIEQVPGISQALAKIIFDFFH